MSVARHPRSKELEGVPVEEIPKISEGSPHVVDRIECGDVDIVINTPTGAGARLTWWTRLDNTGLERGCPGL